MILSPDWLANTFVPLADAPYAMLTLGCLLITIPILTSPEPLHRRQGSIAALVVLFIMGFMVRFTAPVVLIPIALLARGRFSAVRPGRGHRLMLVGIPVAAIAALAALNADAIFGKYITEPFWFVLEADKVGMALNLFASALPAQIVPVFNLGFEVMPPTHKLRPEFGTTPRDLTWVIVGLSISVVLIVGLVKAGRRFFPEVFYLLVILPALGVMIPSTTRYLMSYQSIFWIAFAFGLAILTAPLRRQISSRQATGSAIVAAALATGGLVAMRSAHTARTASGADVAPRIARPPQYVSEVAGTYRSLRHFLESLPAERSLIITSGGDAGRWTVIANRAHYIPDSSMGIVAAEKDLYSVLSCGTPMAASTSTSGIA